MGKLAEMAVGDLIRMWRPLVPGAMVACSPAGLHLPPLPPLPLLSSTALLHMSANPEPIHSTHTAPLTIFTFSKTTGSIFSGAVSSLFPLVIFSFYDD